jgi:DNA polymerase III subunit chi
MPRVDFYVLASAEAQARLRFACRLAEKAYQLGHRIYVCAESREQAALLDDLLWTFRAGSFVPHAVLPASEPLPPVLVGWQEPPEGHADVLVNLASEVPPFADRFGRVAELVDENETTKQRARERFRLYRDRGYSLASHTITGATPDE